MIFFSSKDRPKTPVMWPRSSPEYQMMIPYEYAYVSHRFPYPEHLAHSAKIKLTQQEAEALVEILAEEVGMDRIPRVTYSKNWRAWARVAGRRLHLPNPEYEDGRYLNARVVLHEFAHLISDSKSVDLDNQNGSDYQWGYGKEIGWYRKRKPETRALHHREAFIEALSYLYETTSDLLGLDEGEK